MKQLTRRQFTAAGIIAAVGAATAFAASCNSPACVYGPPPDDYDSTDNIPETVYGPPEDYEQGTEDPESPEQYSDKYDPAENELPDVYGPPPTDD